MKVNKETLTQTYRLKNIIRFNPWSKIVNESVAEHSYFVALFTMLLCRELNVSYNVENIAIKLAILHDIPESVTNDITYDAKETIPGLKDLLDEYESKINKTLFGDMFQELYVDDGDIKIANLIVRLADIISVIQYSYNELKLGNTTFTEILDGSFKRLDEIKAQLERNGVKCQKIII